MAGSIVKLLAVLSLALPCVAQPWTFSRVVDNTTPVPGGTGTFKDFDAPSLAQHRLLFRGFGPALGFEPLGVYLADGPAVTRVADRSTLIPSTGMTFQDFTSVTYDGTTPTYAGGGQNIGGLFAGLGPTTLVTSNTPHPVTGAPLGGVGPASRRGSQMVFLGGSNGSNGTGVFSWSSGQLARIADQTTQIPGGSGTFHSFDGASMSGNRVAFSAIRDASLASGVYLAPVGGGPINVIADQSVTIPGAGGTFSDFTFGTPVLSGEAVAFRASRLGVIYRGVFADFGNGLIRIADSTTLAPSGGLFTNFDTVAIDGSRVAFLANTQAGGQALYFYEGGIIHRVIGQNDFLPSGFVLGLSFSPEGLDGNTLAFRYNLAQNPNMGAIYTATIPAPAALSLLAAPVLVLRRRR